MVKKRAAAPIEALRDPSIALQAYGSVLDQKTGKNVRYNPYAITNKLQATILGYYSNPPRTEFGQVRWLTLLGYRQGGKSLTAELAGYCKTAYTPGLDHVTIADKKDRAEYLHKRVHYNHTRWPAEIRTPNMNSREVRQLTFARNLGGMMRVLSAENGAVGIGQSPDIFHASEVAYWTSAGAQYSLIYPSMINRDHALMLQECTPAPLDAPSASWWMDQCKEAKMGTGRNIYAFFPFWDGKLNQRPWPKDSALEGEEIDLLHRFSSKGLRKEHLAFRRLMLESDVEIRRNPDLFRVYYPFDDVSCWLAAVNGVIHPSLLARHQKADLHEWSGPYQEYEQPEAGAIYVIGVDPAGYAARDHASFQVLKCYDGEWTQVAVYADHTDPRQFTEHVLKAAIKYNNAIVGVESNGVGAAVIALLQEKDCRNLYYEKAYKPGIAATTKSVDQMLSWLQEALRDELILKDDDTVKQLLNYQHDKRVERPAVSEMLRRDGAGKGRRERHHWDKVSALKIAIAVARSAPTRRKPYSEGSGNVLPLFHEMTYDRQRNYIDRLEKSEKDKRRRRARYPKRRRR